MNWSLSGRKRQNPRDDTEADASEIEFVNHRRSDRRAVSEGAVDIWGTALFGLTLKCARCHDHKFEPVLQRDDFRLCAILAGCS